MLKNLKQKGSDFERELVKDIIDSGLDKHARRSIMSGGAFEDGDLKTSLPFSIEAKRHETIKLYKFWEQAKSNNKSYTKRPLLVVKSSFKDTLAVMSWQGFLEILTYAMQGGYDKS